MDLRPPGKKVGMLAKCLEKRDGSGIDAVCVCLFVCVSVTDFLSFFIWLYVKDIINFPYSTFSPAFSLYNILLVASR
jgi:hypothetical protein